jgi:hypothetical protein
MTVVAFSLGVLLGIAVAVMVIELAPEKWGFRR